MTRLKVLSYVLVLTAIVFTLSSRAMAFYCEDEELSYITNELLDARRYDKRMKWLEICGRFREYLDMCGHTRERALREHAEKYYTFVCIEIVNEWKNEKKP